MNGGVKNLSLGVSLAIRFVTCGQCECIATDWDRRESHRLQGDSFLFTTSSHQIEE